jgi:hypothetical protein
MGALAAVLVLFGGSGLQSGSYGPLPGYALSVEGDKASRSQPIRPDDIVHLGVGSRAEITMRPTARAEGPVTVRCFLAQDGRVRDWDAPVEVAKTGAVHLEGERARLFPGVPAGRWEMIFVVGRPGALPSSPGAVEEALRRGGGTDAFRMLRGVVILEGEAP